MSNKIKELQKLMIKQELDFYLVPMRDEFGCEYVPQQNRRLEYITEFTGSAGFVIIKANGKSAFFTDGRYSIQAKMEVNEDDFEIKDITTTKPQEWLEKQIDNNSVIGFDAKIFSIKALETFKEKLDCDFKKTTNLIDEIWEGFFKERPKKNSLKAFHHDIRFAGKTTDDKIAEIIENFSSEYFLITNPESICWLLNIRGNDLEKTPVILSYAFIEKQTSKIILYACKDFNLSFDSNIFVKNLDNIYNDLKVFALKEIAVDAGNCPLIFKDILQGFGCNIIEATDPTILPRGIKNKVEVENIKNAHIRDGAALTKFLFWLENLNNEERAKINEVNIAEKLENLRSNNDNYFSLSFDTIAGWKENGAIVHYRAVKETAKHLEGDGLLLVDSGAQYFDGTTDVTRTIALGKQPTEQQIENFTLVLKGHIGIAMAVFNDGTSGSELDDLARNPLKEKNRDYAHGTGHGVGFFLNVHEGPHGISKINKTSLKVGMVISNEPGYYEEGEYGIRIESLVVVKEIDKGTLGFDTITLAPIDKKLIDESLLTKEEIDWLSNYHEDVYNKLRPLLTDEEAKWLQKF